MRLDVLSIAVVGLGILFLSGAGSAPCPSGTVNINVSTTNDLQNLVDSLQCTGEGVFNVTWVGSLQIDSPFEVSNGTSLTVTGHEPSSSSQDSSSSTSLDGYNFGSGAVINGGGTSGLFSVSNGSALYLNKLVLAGGDAEEGGAVAVRFSSSVNVFGCALINNNAIEGGELT